MKSNGSIKGCLIINLVNINTLTYSTNIFISSSFFAILLLTYLLFISREKYTYLKKSDLGLTLPHFEFLGLYLDMFDQN